MPNFCRLGRSIYKINDFSWNMFSFSLNLTNFDPQSRNSIIWLTLIKSITKLFIEVKQWFEGKKETKEHCNANQVRTGNKQGNTDKTGLSCNSCRIFPVTGKKINDRIILLLSQDFPACSVFYPLWRCSECFVVLPVYTSFCT